MFPNPRKRKAPGTPNTSPDIQPIVKRARFSAEASTDEIPNFDLSENGNNLPATNNPIFSLNISIFATSRESDTSPTSSTYSASPTSSASSTSASSSIPSNPSILENLTTENTFSMFDNFNISPERSASEPLPELESKPDSNTSANNDTTSTSARFKSR